MEAHAKRVSPDECCGLLIGTRARVESVYPARNLLQSRTSYRVDPVDHFAAIRFARETHLAVVGAYHSHVETEAFPSVKDESEAADLDFLYIILSLLTGETRGFCLIRKKLVAVELQVVYQI